VKTLGKVLATIFFSFVAIVTALCCIGFSVCAVGGDGSTAGNRATYALLDLIDIAIMVGAFLLIAKLNKRKPGA
jgi:hypothetical protein